MMRDGRWTRGRFSRFPFAFVSFLIGPSPNSFQFFFLLLLLLLPNESSFCADLSIRFWFHLETKTNNDNSSNKKKRNRVIIYSSWWGRIGVRQPRRWRRCLTPIGREFSWKLPVGIFWESDSREKLGGPGRGSATHRPANWSLKVAEPYLTAFPLFRIF